MPARLPTAAWGLVKEVARHLLRRPVVGFVVCARQGPGGPLLLIRRGDTGGWAPPGGTLEWGETFSQAIPRELREESGCQLLGPATLLGLTSRPDRDPRFHAVTAVFGATVGPPCAPPDNSLEVLEVGFFDEAALPPLSHGLTDVVRAALAGTLTFD